MSDRLKAELPTSSRTQNFTSIKAATVRGSVSHNLLVEIPFTMPPREISFGRRTYIEGWFAADRKRCAGVHPMWYLARIGTVLYVYQGTMGSSLVGFDENVRTTLFLSGVSDEVERRFKQMLCLSPSRRRVSLGAGAVVCSNRLAFRAGWRTSVGAVCRG